MFAREGFGLRFPILMGTDKSGLRLVFGAFAREGFHFRFPYFDGSGQVRLPVIWGFARKGFGFYFPILTEMSETRFRRF